LPFIKELVNPFTTIFVFNVTSASVATDTAPNGANVPLPPIVCGVIPLNNKLEDVNPVAEPIVPLFIIFPENGEAQDIFK
jgi:hypothetical protein